MLVGCATGFPEGQDAGDLTAADVEAQDARVFVPDGSVTLDAEPPLPDAAPCVGGAAQVVGPEGHCYLFFNDSQTWSSARLSCDALVPPAHLATITTAEENALLAPNLGNADWFIGFSDGELEGTFRWVTGETLSYTHWRSGEPNNGNGTVDEDCAVLEGQTGALWDDRACGSTYRHICERE